MHDTKNVVSNVVPEMLRYHAVIHKKYAPMAAGANGINGIQNFMFNISLIGNNDKVDPRASRIIVHGNILNKIIAMAGKKAKFIYDGTRAQMNGIQSLQTQA